MPGIDLGYGNENAGSNSNDDNKEPITDLESGKQDDNGKQDINNPDNKGEQNNDDQKKQEDNKNDDQNDNDTQKQDDNNKGDDGKQNDDDKFANLEPGTTLNVEDKTYTIDKDGNVVDESGNIFKEAKDVQEWLKSFESVDDTTNANELSIKSIQDVMGVEVTDENDKPVEFENTPEGVKSYIDAVLEKNRTENFQTAVNTLYQRYPFLEDIINYYVANGNSLQGWGEMPDRSGIIIDDKNEQQQEAIIRAAWEEKGNRGDVNGYIAYLKNSGTLLSVAQDELKGMQEADAQYKKEMADKAEQEEKERTEQLKQYWQGVHEIIQKKEIAGYKIPDSIIINKNGQKSTATPDDFFNYIYRVDDKGKSQYENDLAKDEPVDRLQDEILRAYLKFVGGNYSNLVDMAINNKKVEQLRLRAKQKNGKSISITRPPQNNNKKDGNIDVGY